MAKWPNGQEMSRDQWDKLQGAWLEVWFDFSSPFGDVWIRPGECISGENICLEPESMNEMVRLVRESGRRAVRYDGPYNQYDYD